MISHWNAFLPIGRPLASDEPGIDPTWAAAMGVERDALAVLRAVRRRVPQALQYASRAGRVERFSFLVHDRTSGVPCHPDDDSAYLHLRLEMRGRRDLCKCLPVGWVFVARVDPSPEEIAVQRVIAEQSAWYLRLVEEASEMSEVDLLRHVGQTLHYFANMAQMVVR